MFETQWKTNEVKPTANATPAKIATTPPKVLKPVTACVVASVVKNISVTTERLSLSQCLEPYQINRLPLC